MTYKVKKNVTREELAAAVDALCPFYAFGSVLSTAQDERGYAWVNLYNGDPKMAHADDFGSEQTMERLSDEGCIVGVNASWEKTPATFSGPVLREKDFFAARAAFLACIEPDE